MGSEHTRDMIANASGNALALEQIAYRLESSLTASQARVRELERVIGRKDSELFRVHGRAETAERERDEARRERDELRSNLSASAMDYIHAVNRVRSAERERDEAVARAEEAEEKARRLSARLDKVDPARAYKLVGTAAERVSPPALGVYPPRAYYQQCGGQPFPNGSLCSRCFAYTGSSGICTRMIEVSTRPNPDRSDAGGEEPER